MVRNLTHWNLTFLPSSVNLCGKVKMVCFDKTGTLTEDSMNVLGVMDVSDKRCIVWAPVLFSFTA